MSMRFEWDEPKRRSNLRKHGIDFADCEEIFRGTTITVEDTRANYAEERLVSLGLLQDRVIVVAHTETHRTIRFISARKATRHEQKTYFEAIAN